MHPKRIMVLCTGNSCRSQMAEGFLKADWGDRVEAHSAGLLVTEVHPRAIAVMSEVHIDISEHSSKLIDPALLAEMDIVITVCDTARDSCPNIPASANHIHMPVRDPVNTVGTEEEIMADFRRARDEIREKLQDVLKGATGPL